MIYTLSFSVYPKRLFIRIIFFSALLIVFIFKANGQEVYQHLSHEDIYDFVDELANAHLINLNTSIKPYARILIAEKLKEVNEKKELLNNRQRNDLIFYLRDYNKELLSDNKFNKRYDLFFYRDSLFNFSLNPILGINYFKNDSGGFYHRWNGAEAFGYVGKNFGIYASLRDNRETQRLTSHTYLNRYTGADYKLAGSKDGGDYSEMRGGVTYTWKWGSVGLVKDHFVWGDNYHGSNIFSGLTPSFAHIKLNMHPIGWLNFNYVHGWLISEVIDSNRIYLVNGVLNRLVFRQKYVAANMLSFTRIKNLNVSVGNSIIYSDVSVQPAYLIPVFFYKSVDHTLTGAGADELGQNSQMFFNISSRNIKNVHLYTSWFVDEIAFGRAFNSETQTNYFSAKFGVHTSNFILQNLFLTAEYTRTNPVVYRHYVITTTFASNNYNLGHYLGDNAHEFFLSAGFKPVAKLFVEASFTKAQKGVEYAYTGASGTYGDGMGHPFIGGLYWQSVETAFKIKYQPLNDCYLSFSFLHSDVHGIMEETYTQPEFIGTHNTINVGVNISF